MGVCSRHINENFLVETVSTIKWLHAKFKRVSFSILSAVAILSRIVATMLLENEAIVFLEIFLQICDVISDSNEKSDE